jgi:hypothetical protein
MVEDGDLGGGILRRDVVEHDAHLVGVGRGGDEVVGRLGGVGENFGVGGRHHRDLVFFGLGAQRFGVAGAPGHDGRGASVEELLVLLLGDRHLVLVVLVQQFDFVATDAALGVEIVDVGQNAVVEGHPDIRCGAGEVRDHTDDDLALRIAGVFVAGGRACRKWEEEQGDRRAS